MKKSIALLCVILSTMHFAAKSYAVHLSTDGTGEVLIFPYYTVNGGFNSLITLTNTTDEAKALRVRFREAANSREVFAFNLYLGPNDVWTGALVPQSGIVPQGLTKLITNDLSCTYPTIENSLFTNTKYTGDFADNYGVDDSRMREGFVEVIEMGVITGDSAIATIMISGQTTQNCSILSDAWDENSGNSYWLDDATTDLQAPSGGIVGNLILIDVARGISVSEPVTALQNFSDEIIHFSRDSDSPSLADGNKISVLRDKRGETTVVDWATGIQAVSAVLSSRTITNEYIVQQSIGASTDWIMTMPTRQYHVDPQYAVADVPLAPFVELETPAHKYCQPYYYSKIFNRESTDASHVEPVVVGSPQLPQVLFHTLCHASNSLSFFPVEDIVEEPFGFLKSSFPVVSILNSGEVINTFLPAIYKQGFVELAFEDQVVHPMVDGTEIDVYGLPIIGFSLQNYVNNNAQAGVLANYAGIFEHKNSSGVDTNSQVVTNPMQVASDGIGGVLIYPYYTVSNDFNTLITVVNPTDEVKAVTVRFLEGKNNRECLAFNLYLDAYDVWTSALLATESTIPSYVGEPSVKLITNDNSCLVPNSISSLGQEFNPSNFTGEFDDGLGANLSRCTEGHIEIIDMGQLLSTDALATMHTTEGLPQNCELLEQNWHPATGKWGRDASENLIPSVAGIYGSVSLLDIGSGIDISYDATAIINFSTQVMHNSPGSLLPNLSSGNIVSTIITDEDISYHSHWTSSIDAVSALFMQSQISNDFVTTDAIGAQTTWVNLYPTKQFYSDPIYQVNAPLAPFDMVLNQSGACDEHGFKAYNREQMSNKVESSGIVPGVSPPGLEPVIPNHCWGLNVGQVETQEGDNSGAIFDSNLANIQNGSGEYYLINQMPFDTGVMQIDYDSESSKLVGTSDAGGVHIIYGKPVIGFVAQKYVNASLRGQGSTLANYAVANMNKSKRKISVTID